MQCERTFVQLNRAGSCGFVWDRRFIAIGEESKPPDLIDNSSRSWSWYWSLVVTENGVVLFEANFDKLIPTGANTERLEPHTLIFEVA